MGLNNNFDSITIAADGLEIRGTSGIMENAELTARRVAVKQNDILVEGPADMALNWKAVPPLDAAKFTADDKALAVGTETYLIREPAPGYVTVTWAQVVDVGKAV
jgi:hypothetical protein